MFNNYKEYYDKFVNYLKTQEAQLNTSDMGEGFYSTANVIAHIYDTNMKYHYYTKYSEESKSLILTNDSLKEKEYMNKMKIKPIYHVNSKAYAYIDTLKKIEHYVLFNSCALIFTDFGVIKIGEGGNIEDGVAKISQFNVWVIDEKYKEPIEKFINDNVIPIPTDNKNKNVSVCTQGPYGLQEADIEMEPFDCDIETNYNDDLPYEEINELINGDEEELILLHGEPGTGKTSIIKKLITENKDINFIYFDFNLFTSFSDSKVFSFLMEHKNSVFIIEDCEKLFTSRSNGNSYLNTMLNLTDGIIGQTFAIKFICTFNCPPTQLDDAITRKGRLSLIYEFKKLSLEKAKKLLPSATEPKTLADIYAKDNGMKTKTKIGF